MAACKAIRKLPESLLSLEMLSSLDRRNSSNLTLIPSLRNLSHLKELILMNCISLITIRQLPSSLTKLRLNECTALERLENVSNLENLIELHLTGCMSLTDINGLDRLAALRRLHMSGCDSLSHASKNQLVKEIFEHLETFSIPGSEIPNWFSTRQLSYEGMPILLDIREGMELILCLVAGIVGRDDSWYCIPTVTVETEADVLKEVKPSGINLSGKTITFACGIIRRLTGYSFVVE